MRKFLFVFALLPFLAQAQTVTKGEASMVYSLPKTELIIHITTEEIKEEPGRFYRYSERYLAVKDAILEEKTSYRLKSIAIETQTVPDKQRTYTIRPAKKSIASNITVNNDGLLCGINVEPVQIPLKPVQIVSEPPVQDAVQQLLPLSEEYMMAGSTAKMAEGAAKDIYRLRENRADILAGDVDYVPVDGASLKAMLQEIDAQEKALTDLFIGKRSSSTKTQTIRYTPAKASKDEVLFRFSSFAGLVDKDELSGEPYYINIRYEPVKELTDPKIKENKKEEVVYALIPVSAEIKIDNGKKDFFNQGVLLPQLGVLTPIPFATMDRYSKAYVSPETGRLLSVEQNKK